MSSMYQMVNSFPMLRNGEEEALWIEYFDENTKKSRKKIIRDKMITSHLRMALKGAKKWMGSKLPLQDLFGQAQEGLIQAFDKFSPEHGTKFATYAPWWIRAKVEMYVMDNASAVKMGTTAFSKYLFFNYNKLRNQQEIENPDLNQDQIDVMVAKKLIEDEKAPSGDLEKTLKQIRDFKIKKSAAASLDAPVSDEGEGASFIDYIVDPNMRPAVDIIQEDEEKQMGRDFLVSAREEFIRIGKSREWEILKARRLDEPHKTLEDLSPIYGVSRERVRQIEVRAMERLQGMAKKDFKAMSLQEEHPSRAVTRKPKKTRIAIPVIPERPKPNPVVHIKGDIRPVIDPELSPKPSQSIEQVEEPLISIPSYQPKQKRIVVSNSSVQIDMVKTDMVDILRNLDFSIESYPYIPKSVDFEEMVEAVHQFALGNMDYFERSTKVINGIEYPHVGRWVYVGVTVGQPQLNSRFSTVAEWNAIAQKTLGHRELVVEEPLTVIPSCPVELEKETGMHCPDIEINDTPSIVDNGFSFVEERAVPYKPWTLNIGGETHHLSGTDKNVVEHLLNSEQPQSKDDLFSAQISFTGQMQGKLKDLGLLQVYKKEGIARKTFYAIATEHHNPTYDGFYKRGEPQPTTQKPVSKTVSNLPSTKPGNPTKTLQIESAFSIGALLITPSNNTVTYEGKSLPHVTSKPYEALVLMAKKHGDFVTKEELSIHFFGNSESKSVAQIDIGIKGLANLIDRSVPNLSQSLIMKVGDKGYALTVSFEDRHAIYEKAGIANPFVKRKMKFASPHGKSKSDGKAVDAMNIVTDNRKAQPQQKGGGRRSMAEQLSGFKIR